MQQLPRRYVFSEQPSMWRTPAVLATSMLLAAGQAASQTSQTVLPQQPITISDPSDSGRSTQLYYKGGGVELSFSAGAYTIEQVPSNVGGAVNFLNAAALQLSVVGDGTYVEQYREDPDLNMQIRVDARLQAAARQMDIISGGESAGTLQGVAAAGGLQLQSRSNLILAGYITGGTASIRNLRIDLAAGHVMADINGTRPAIGTRPTLVVNSPNTLLWTFDPVADVTGVARLNPASLFAQDPVSALRSDGVSVQCDGPDQSCFTYQLTNEFTLNNLTMTAMGVQRLSDSLGVYSVGLSDMNAVNSSPGKWGSMHITQVFSNVPEPSTYAFMGLGLAGIALASRRKKFTQPA